MNTLLSVPVNCVSDADLPAILPSKASDELQNQFRDEHATPTILIKICLRVFTIWAHQTENNLSSLFLDVDPCYWP